MCPFLGIILKILSAIAPLLLPQSRSRSTAPEPCFLLSVFRFQAVLSTVLAIWPRPWRAWLHTSTGSACAQPRPPNPASPAPRDSELPADPSLSRRESAQSSAPAG